MESEDNAINYFLFLRIGKEKYIDPLQKEGLIHCTPIRHFRNKQSLGLKADVNEGKAYLKQVKDIQLSHKGKLIAKMKEGQLYYDNPNDMGNIYCLYGVQTALVDLTMKSLQKVHVESEATNFGTTALIIHDPGEFRDRIFKSLDNLSKDYNFSPVRYYDPKSFEGELSPFFKSSEFDYQNEVRLWVPMREEKPYQFKIGDISDISYKCSVKELDKIEVEVLKPIKRK